MISVSKFVSHCKELIIINIFFKENFRKNLFDVGGGGGGCLQGLKYYFPHFQHFPYSKGVQVKIVLKLNIRNV